MMFLTSSDFAEGQPIPDKYTCDGLSISPPLRWKDAPANTQSFAIVLEAPEKPDGIRVHWLIYNLGADIFELPENMPAAAEFTNGTRQGLNDFKKVGYGAPCPARGYKRQYIFHLYALDSRLNVDKEITEDALMKAMQGHILAEAQLKTTFGR